LTAPRGGRYAFHMDMRTIETEEQLTEILDASREQPVLIFKHSTMCPISSRAHHEVERFLKGQEDGAFGFGKVVVQTARRVSNKVAEDLGIEHESPQAIVVRDGKAVWDASHFAITSDALAKALGAR
jgi:bacillithiol system protein YtxJ